MKSAKLVVLGVAFALGLSAPAVAHKDHNKTQTAVAAEAASGHAGMDHDATSPRGHDVAAAGANATPAGQRAEIGKHDERRELAETKPVFVRVLDWLGRLHTSVVHFPVGLTLAALLAEVIGRRRSNPDWRTSARVMLAIAAVGAVASTALGWVNAGFYVNDTDGVLTAHRWLGTGLAVLSVALAFAAWRSTRRPAAPRTAYWSLLVASSAVVAVQGYLGGSLVHGGLDHLAF